MRPVSSNTCGVRDAQLDDLLRLNGEDFVRAAYEFLLVRPAAPAELPSWVEALRRGKLTKPEVLAAVNRFIDDVRASGLLQAAIASSGVVGLEPAPAGSWQPSVPD